MTNTVETMRAQQNGAARPAAPGATPEAALRELLAKQIGYLTLTVMELQVEVATLRAAQAAPQPQVADDQPRPSA